MLLLRHNIDIEHHAYAVADKATKTIASDFQKYKNKITR